MAFDEAKENKPEPASPGRAVERWVLEDLEALTRSLRDLTEVLTRLRGRIETFLPKMAATEADAESGRVSGGEVSREGVDALVEKQFQEIFGEEKPPREARAGSAVAAAAGEEERRAGLWLRFQQGTRILEVPCSWAGDTAADQIAQAVQERGRIRLEDETGEAEIPVDRVLGIVFSSQRSKPSEGAFRPKNVQDLALLGPGGGWAGGGPRAEAVSDAPRDGGDRFDPKDVADAVRGRTVVVASRSGIVRRFLRRHLEMFGLTVVESQDPVPRLPDGDCLGLFWDGDATRAEKVLPGGLPVVRLSDRVDRSDVSTESGTPVLAKPFSREEVGRVLLWMARREALLRSRDDDESRPRSQASGSASDSG